MKNFNQNATMFLIEKLHSLRYFHNSWRAVHLQLSGRQARYNRTLTLFISRALTELFSNDDGFIYFCKDGDIIILFQGRATPILKKLGAYFADVDPVYEGDNFDRYFTTYDLSKDWTSFSGMCHLKAIETDAWERPFRTPLALYFQREEAPGL